MADDIDYLRDLDCLQGFAEQYPSLWYDWVETYKLRVAGDEIEHKLNDWRENEEV